MEHFLSWGGSERFRRLGLYEDLTRGNCPTIRRVKILITYARRSQPDQRKTGHVSGPMKFFGPRTFSFPRKILQPIPRPGDVVDHEIRCSKGDKHL